MAYLPTDKPKLSFTPYQLKIIEAIPEKGTILGPDLERKCTKQPGVPYPDSDWRKSRSRFYSELKTLINVGSVERVPVIRFVGRKKDIFGYRIKRTETTTAGQFLR